MNTKEKIFNLQQESQLARLLATENITVHHGNAKTAAFDTKNRILILPIWNDLNKTVYDMLVGHEVGHALWTNINVEELIEKHPKIPFDLFNIVEDVRIERMIQNKYPGIRRIFRDAYDSLHEKDFFEIANKDLDKVSFPDKINLKAKLGDRISIAFENEVEQSLFDECFKTETFEEVEELTLKIYEYLKSIQKKKKKETKPSELEEVDEESTDLSDVSGAIEPTETKESDETEEDSEETKESEEDSEETEEEPTETKESEEDSEETKESEETEEDSEDSTPKEENDNENAVTSNSEEEEDDGEEGDESEDLPESMCSTAKAMEQNLEKSVCDNDGFSHLVKGSQKTFNDEITSYKTLIKNRKVDMSKRATDSVYKKERKEIDTEASKLHKEFERRKAAWQYARAQESKSGEIDVNKLHAYKYEDEIFKSFSTIKDAKSHGMIFYLDYSASMNNQLGQMLKQTLHLVTFCRKAQIPFEVYTYTCKFDGNCQDMEFLREVDGVISPKFLQICNLFSSKMNKTEFEDAFYQTWIIASRDWYIRKNLISDFEKLGSTPLNHTLVFAYDQINAFMKENKVQKMNTMILSDGDSHNISYKGNFSSNMTLKLGNKLRRIDSSNAKSQTLSMLKILRTIPNNTVIGFYLPNSDKSRLSKMKAILGYDRERIKAASSKFNKEGTLSFKGNEAAGYDELFILSVNNEIKTEEFTYNSDDADFNKKNEQRKLAKKFAGHNLEKKQKKIFTNKLVDRLA